MAAKKEKDTEDSFRQLVHRCIGAYRDLMNVGMALDLCRVSGKQRTFIMRDAEFQTETRAIRAEKYKQELEEVQEIYEAASKLGDSGSGYEGDDGRDVKGRRVPTGAVIRFSCVMKFLIG